MNTPEFIIETPSVLTMEVDSNATTWGNVALKPFETIGTGLEVISGALNATATGNVDDVKVNGTSVVDEDKIALVTVPTKTSDITNDSGFITSSYHDSTKQDVIDTEHKLSSDLVDDTDATNKFVTAANKTTWNNKQDAISDLDTIRNNASAGASAASTISGYGDVVTHNTSEFATDAQGNRADTAVQPGDNVSDLTNDAGYITSASLVGKEDKANKVSAIASTASVDLYPSVRAVMNYHDVQKENADATILKQANIINTTSSTSTVAPLSANMGKNLQDQIDNLKNIGRFLSIWNASTGTPASEPPESPYSYKVGDYFRIGTAGTKNPANNSTYTTGGTNWVEGGALAVGDVVYISSISGSTVTWVKQSSGGSGTVTDVKVNNGTILNGGVAAFNVDTNTLNWSNSTNTISAKYIVKVREIT